MVSKQRLWITTMLVVVLMMMPTSLVGGSKQTTQISRDADMAQALALAPKAAQLEDNLSVMTGARQSTLEAPAAQDDSCTDDEAGKRLKCKSRRLMSEVCETADLAAHDDVGIFAQSTQADLTDMCDFGTDVVEATDEAEFKSVGMRRKAGGGAGAVMEYVGEDPRDDGDNDGICKPTGKYDVDVSASGDGGDDGKKPTNLYKEWCAEVIGDGIGDEDGFCEYQDKGQDRYLEPCVQVSGVDSIDGQEENFDTDKIAAIEDALDRSTETMAASNTALVQGMEGLRAERAISRELLTGDGPEQCESMMQSEPAARVAWGVILGVNAGAWVAEMALDTCSPFAQQDAFGFNGSSICAAFAVAKGATSIAGQTMEYLDDTITGTRVDNAVKCLEFLGTKVTDLGDGQDEANDKLDQVLANQEEIIRLLNLPPGQRPEFPGCDNDGRCDPQEDAENCPSDCGI